MTHFAAFQRWQTVCAIAVTCAALLSSPGAIADTQLFAVLSNGQPASIDPLTGAVTPIGNQLGGSNWDVVAAANTLYVQPFGGPASTALDEVDVTSGQLTTVPHTNIPPGVGISDLTIHETGVSPVAEPATAFLFLSSFAGLIGFRQRRRSDRAASPNST